MLLLFIMTATTEVLSGDSWNWKHLLTSADDLGMRDF
jgi:hypothetical protein